MKLDPPLKLRKKNMDYASHPKSPYTQYTRLTGPKFGQRLHTTIICASSVLMMEIAPKTYNYSKGRTCT